MPPRLLRLALVLTLLLCGAPAHGWQDDLAAHRASSVAATTVADGHGIHPTDDKRLIVVQPLPAPAAVPGGLGHGSSGHACDDQAGRAPDRTGSGQHPAGSPTSLPSPPDSDPPAAGMPEPTGGRGLLLLRCISRT
jgi:hypothetical protein